MFLKKATELNFVSQKIVMEFEGKESVVNTLK